MNNSELEYTEFSIVRFMLRKYKKQETFIE